jgi:hypothetical protein
MTTIPPRVKAPGYIVGGAAVLILILANGALAGGAYQRTEDQKKAFVWNNDPKPEDAATWSGGRDAGGYATGPGTLKWFRTERAFVTGSNVRTPKKTLIGSYSGTMVRGKFDGAVMTVYQGKTYHTTFVDGHKKGRWIAGSLMTKAESVEPAAAAEKPNRTESSISTEVAGEPAKTEKTPEAKAQSRVGEETTAEVPAEGPGEEKPEVTSRKAEISKAEETKEENPATTEKVSEPMIAQAASTEEPDQSATPRQPVTRKAALQPGAVRAIERPTSVVAKKPETEPTRKSERTKRGKSEEPSRTAIPASSQPNAEASISEDVPAESPPVATERLTTESSPPSAKETPVDESIRALTGPPSSLRVPAPPETKPPTQVSTPPTAAVSSPIAGPKLTAVQAMDIADIEARTNGYDLGEYQLPKAEYNAASDIW